MLKYDKAPADHFVKLMSSSSLASQFQVPIILQKKESL